MPMGSQRGTFKSVFDEAPQRILGNTFDMELVELPTRAAVHDTTGNVPGARTASSERHPCYLFFTILFAYSFVGCTSTRPQKSLS